MKLASPGSRPAEAPGCRREAAAQEARVRDWSRALHLVLFPLFRVLATLSALPVLEAQVGTVLYVFRKVGSELPARSSLPSEGLDAASVS